MHWHVALEIEQMKVANISIKRVRIIDSGAGLVHVYTFTAFSLPVPFFHPDPWVSFKQVK